MASNKADRLPRDVARRIVDRIAHGQKAVVVTARRGVPSRVFDLDAYQKMQELPRKIQPWARRKPKNATPKPLGVVDGKVLVPLSRERIYE